MVSVTAWAIVMLAVLYAATILIACKISDKKKERDNG